MRYIPNGTDRRPRRCAVLPNRTTDPEGFVETGHVLTGWDNEIVLSKTGLREAARHAGLPTEELVSNQDSELNRLRTQVSELETKVAELEDENMELSAWLDSVDVLESKAFRARRAPGRPKQKKKKTTTKQKAAA